VFTQKESRALLSDGKCPQSQPLGVGSDHQSGFPAHLGPSEAWARNDLFSGTKEQEHIPTTSYSPVAEGIAVLSVPQPFLQQQVSLVPHNHSMAYSSVAEF